MSDDSEQNKSEQPTSFKLNKSREKGMVARGMDLGFLTSLAAFAGFAWIAMPSFAGALGKSARDAFVTAPNVAGGASEILAVTRILMAPAVRPLAMMGIAIFVAVLLFELVQTGVVFTFQPLKPDFSKLNPGKGLKRLFSVRLLIETLKNVLKLGAYSVVAWLVVAGALRERASGIVDASTLLDAFGSTAFKLIASFIGVALVFMLLDQFVSRREFLKKMRMSRREVRREHRDREGEPRIKQKRKQLHGEFTKASEGLRNVKGSDVVITNPTRIAVALKYDGDTMAAPVVVAKGAHDFAGRIRRLAFQHNVVIVEDKMLARDLFKRCMVGREIPDDRFRRVADIYLTLRRNRGEAQHA